MVSTGLNYAVSTTAMIIMVALGIAALIGGGIIAFLAARRAPDGFEDKEGFHAEKPPPRSPSK